MKDREGGCMTCRSTLRGLPGYVLALTVVMAWPAYAQDASRLKANVSVHISGTSRTGRTGVPTSEATHTVAVGQTAVIGVSGGFSGAMGSGGWPIGGDTSYAWRVETRVKAIESNTVELTVAWQRFAPGNRADGAGVGDVRVIRLSTTERHVLDFVHTDDASSPTVNLLVEIEASRAPELEEGVVLDYDFWLVHEDRFGTKTTEHQSYGGFQGDKMSVAFKPLGFNLDGTRAPDAAAAPLRVSVNGHLTGYLKPDGAIDASLSTEVWLACGSGRSGGGGVKQFVAREGETVSVEVPASIGWCTIAGTRVVPADARSGVSATPAGLRVTSREFFTGDRFSLLVRVRRLR
jgi:hypothetical protein